MLSKEERTKIVSTPINLKNSRGQTMKGDRSSLDSPKATTKLKRMTNSRSRALPSLKTFLKRV